MENLEMNKLFIGNLHWNVRWPELKEYFGQWWEVAYASVALDKESNRSRWFGFVTFVNEPDAIKAKEEANETELEGRPMYIDFARARPDGEGDDNDADESTQEQDGDDSSEESEEASE